MASPASPSRRQHRHRHHSIQDSPVLAPSTPTSPKSPTSSRQTSRDRTPQSPTRPPSASRQHHTRSSSQNYTRRSVSRDGDLGQRPTTSRRHTTQVVPVISTRTRPLPPIPHKSYEEKYTSPSRSRESKRSHSTPAPIQKDGHILIPVPIRAQDAQTPLYVRAPPGQSVDFVFSPPKKKGLIERLLSNIEWEDKTPLADKPYRYQKPPSPDSSRPFYKRLLS